MALTKHILIIGGKGALGSTLIEHFKLKGFAVASVDKSINYAADFSIVLETLEEVRGSEGDAKIRNVLNQDHPGLKFDAIICVAGGWVGGTIAEYQDLAKNAEAMWTQCVASSMIAASLAATHLKEGHGLLVLTGAKAALEPTPSMVAYGVAKAAVHHLTKSLGVKGSGLPQGAKVVALLPLVLDTPTNRNVMPEADTTTWTPLEYVAGLISSWINLDNAPKSGSLIQLITRKGETKIEIK